VTLQVMSARTYSNSEMPAVFPRPLDGMFV
jgi:hypothetical protein